MYQMFFVGFRIYQIWGWRLQTFVACYPLSQPGEEVQDVRLRLNMNRGYPSSSKQVSTPVLGWLFELQSVLTWLGRASGPRIWRPGPALERYCPGRT